MKLHCYIAIAAVSAFLCLPCFAQGCGPALVGNEAVTSKNQKSFYIGFLRNIAKLVNRNHVSWNAPLLSNKKVTTPERAKQIVDVAFNDPAFSKDFDSFIDGLGGIQSSRLWDEYFRGYDATVGYCEGYSQLVEGASAALPKIGLIRDYGSGTGNFSAGLLAAAPSRKVEAMDISPLGLQSTKDKVAATTPNAQFAARITNLKDYAAQPGDAQASGAVMNNVLYTFKSREEKKLLLKRVFEDLKAGGVFVLNDPIPLAQTSKENLQGFIEEIGVSAVKNGSPMNENDLSLVAAVNLKVLTGGASPFTSASELRALVEEVGFVVSEQSTGYYDRVSTFVLRKP